MLKLWKMSNVHAAVTLDYESRTFELETYIVGCFFNPDNLLKQLGDMITSTCGG